MKTRPPYPGLLQEDLDALGLNVDRVVEILLGPGVQIPPPPEGDPRRDMSLDEARCFVAEGEKIDLDFNRWIEGTHDNPDIKEMYTFKFPSGFSTQVDEKGARGFLLQQSVIDPWATTVLHKAQSYRKTTLWPHERIHRSRIMIQERTFYS